MKLRRILAAMAALCFWMSHPLSAQETPQQATAVSEDAAANANIARLIAVWGFIKYHHPDARSGTLAMDREFFALYPGIKAAGSREEADAIILDWVDGLGAGQPCNPCAEPAEDIAITSPTPAWLASTDLDPKLRERLGAIYRNRGGGTGNFQVEATRGIGHAIFVNEPNYRSAGELGEMHRLLGLARLWNVLRYWFPYRDIMDQGLDRVLADAIPSFVAAGSRRDWHRALAKLTRASDDGHFIVYDAEPSLSPAGDCALPHNLRFIGDDLVVAKSRLADDGAPVLRNGDVLRAIEARSVADLSEAYRPFVSASNRGWEDYVLAARLASGPCGLRTVEIERDGTAMTLEVEWREARSLPGRQRPKFDRDGETFQWLPGNIAYLKLSDIKRADVDRYMEEASTGRGLVVDIRNYPSEFVVFDLGRWLVEEPTPFARFTLPSVATPGEFSWRPALSLEPDPQGRKLTVPVMALIGENSLSQAEYTAMALRAGGATLVGSPTAGADGNVIRFTTTHGERGQITGIGTFYPDKTPTQRVGIIPDVVVRPSVEGIREGRDEVLERAIEEIRKMPVKAGNRRQ